ncbi:RNA polymerase sigma factor [Corynebacterium jeikeium]|uniref:ECF-family sigma factor M n=2 Tax=Corynebacterium jeikeium TaxID=38289 RepID=Q4JSD3_CORJK|nr:sigma-70 family RNA polymerase sigma factor [Corynebacterium jeikeium]CAI38274.1 ECF-family sigma factor M [Corynebacterium jeikeium K411]
MMLGASQNTKNDTRPAQQTDHELLRGHNDGQPGAFRELIDRHQRTLWWAVRRVNVPEGHQMDVYQEGLLRVHRFAARFNGDRSASVSTWMATIMRNAALSYMQRYSREAQPGREDFNECTRTLPARGMREEATVARLDVHRSLRRLSPEMRDVMVLTEIRGLSEAKAAAQLGIPVGTVKSRKNRAKRMMYEHLGGAEEYGMAVAG